MGRGGGWEWGEGKGYGWVCDASGGMLTLELDGGVAGHG